MPKKANFLSSMSFSEFQTVKFKHISHLTFAQVFRVLVQVIGVFQVFLSSSLTEFEL